MSYLYQHQSLLPFLLFTCNAQEQAWEAKHLRPWQTHASQKSQIAPTIAIPNEYETIRKCWPYENARDIRIFEDFLRYQI